MVARSARIFAAVALGLPLAALVAACASETITLASIPDNDAGVPAAPQKCVSGSCPNGYYCSLPECGAVTGGTCELFPPVCPPTEDPYCGCDQVTYFNDCLRRANGVSSSFKGPCLDFGLPCGSGAGGASGGPPASCPDGALCAQLGGFTHGACDHPIPGTCWVLPANCAATTPSDYWDSCSGTGGDCLSTCAAIRAEGAYRRSQQCP